MASRLSIICFQHLFLILDLTHIFIASANFFDAFRKSLKEGDNEDEAER